MIPFEMIPKGRTLMDKRMYLFWSWYIRKHRKEFEAKIRE